MCGIVGLMIKNPKMKDSIGELMLPMLIGMTERGPDSAGMAMFTAPVAADTRKFSLYSGDDDFNWAKLGHDFKQHLNVPASIEPKSNHAVLTTTLTPATVKMWLAEHYPQLHLLSVGQLMDIYKDTGTPQQVADRYDFKNFKGSHLVGHTRMATESAITPAHAHPFFETDNDTEAACRYLQWRMREGDDLETALNHGFEELDGFYTLLMGTSTELALVRDPYGCKPAMIAEHDDYVAIASEFRSLAHLPDIKNAHVFEPSPKEMYVWKL